MSDQTLGQEELPLETEHTVTLPMFAPPAPPEPITFPPFSGKDATCVKCGSTAPRYTHHDGVSTWLPCWIAYMTLPFNSPGRLVPEHMDRRCYDCGHEWVEDIFREGP